MFQFGPASLNPFIDFMKEFEWFDRSKSIDSRLARPFGDIFARIGLCQQGDASLLWVIGVSANVVCSNVLDTKGSRSP